MTSSVTQKEIRTFSRTGVYGIVFEEGKILVVRQQHTSTPNKLDLPGGGIEPGETIEDALRREFSEEVAMGFKSMQLFKNVTAMSEKRDQNGESYFFHQIGLIYRVDHLIPLENKTPELESFWIDPKQINKEMCCPLLKEILPFF